MELCDVGIVGLGTMGANLLLNLERNGFRGAGFDIDPHTARAFFDGAAKDRRIVLVDDWRALALLLQRPRKVLVLVPAGGAVDNVLAQLQAVLEPGDVIADCGNSHFLDTARRETALAKKGFHFLGVGLSGGEQGAREGAALMCGGSRTGYELLAPLLEAAAAPEGDGACLAYLGPGGAGHYVKMVHNGIEYGGMQLIAEAYDLLRRVGGLTNHALAEVFDGWNSGVLESYLIAITARVLRMRDREGSGFLLERIRDRAAMTGTGTWAVREALEIGVPVPTIAAAVDTRLLSAMGSLRSAVHGLAADAGEESHGGAEWSDSVGAALFCANICCYAQGMAMLGGAASVRKMDLPRAEIARIWKNGCIIRARILRDIQAAYSREAQLPHLLLDPYLHGEMTRRQDALRDVVATGVRHGVPLPAFSSALAYTDTLRNRQLPTNLIQAQRDLFGAHGYNRVDREGLIHTQWD